MTQPPGPAIRAQGLRKGFGAGWALKDVSLELGWGRTLALFGANGSGKTTLLRLLATRYRPDRGRLWVGGYERGRADGHIRRVIGVIAHQPMLYQNMTCQENLHFFGRMYGLKDVKRRAADALDRVGIASRHQRVRALSHGLQKRLAMARAILHDPPILLMDEPESGLDQGALEALTGLLTMESGQRRTVVMATHSVDWALGQADEVAVLSAGVIAYRSMKQALDPAAFRSAYTGAAAS